MTSLSINPRVDFSIPDYNQDCSVCSHIKVLDLLKEINELEKQLENSRAEILKWKSLYGDVNRKLIEERTFQ